MGAGRKVSGDRCRIKGGRAIIVKGPAPGEAAGEAFAPAPETCALATECTPSAPMISCGSSPSRVVSDERVSTRRVQAQAAERAASHGIDQNRLQRGAMEDGIGCAPAAGGESPAGTPRAVGRCVHRPAGSPRVPASAAEAPASGPVFQASGGVWGKLQAAPTSSSAAARSRMTLAIPCRARPSAAVSPAMPAPMIATGAGVIRPQAARVW